MYLSYARLHQICRRERITADFTSLIALAEKSGNDVRSCLSMLQFFASMRKPLTIIDVLKSNIGQKDMQKGLFTIWESIFQVSLLAEPFLFGYLKSNIFYAD